MCSSRSISQINVQKNYLIPSASYNFNFQHDIKSRVSNHGEQSSLREGISGHNFSAMYKTLKCICYSLELHAKEGLTDFDDCTGLCHIKMLIVVISRIDSELVVISRRDK